MAKIRGERDLLEAVLKNEAYRHDQMVKEHTMPGIISYSSHSIRVFEVQLIWDLGASRVFA